MPKPGNWGDWAVIHKPKPDMSSICGGCGHCDEDGSCNVLPVSAWDIGPSYWKRCPHYVNGYRNQQKNTTTSCSSSQPLANNHDCRYCSYATASKQYVCNNIDSPYYNQECTKCRYYIREVIICNGKKMSRIEYEQLSSKSSEKSRSNGSLQSNVASNPLQKQSKKRKTKSAVSQAKHSDKNTCKATGQKEKKVAHANPKTGCKFLENTQCIIQHASCTRGNVNCLFYKQKQCERR